jgi:hypothetical protein
MSKLSSHMAELVHDVAWQVKGGKVCRGYHHVDILIGLPMIPFWCKSEAITYFNKSMLYNVALPRDSSMFPAHFQFQKWKCMPFF